MALHPEIALGVKPPDILNPGQLMSLQNVSQQNQLGQLQIDDLLRERGEQDQLRSLFRDSSLIDPKTGTVSLEGVGKAYSISPKAGATLSKDRQSSLKTAAEMEKLDLEAKTTKAKYWRDQMSSVDPTNYPQFIQAAKADGMRFAAEAPAQFSPDWIRRNAMDADKFITQNTPKIEMKDVGGQLVPVDVNPVTNPAIGKTNLAKTTTPDARLTDARARETLTETKRHHAAIEGDPATIETTAQAIASGKLAPLTGFALARPMAQNIMSRVVEINPDFDPTQYGTRQKAEKDFATGKQGNTVRSFNVALSHLDTLDQLADALHNGNTQLVNKFGNAIATATGSAAPTNFVAAKKIVGDEIVKAIVGSGGGVSDREEAAKTIAAANSPAQLKGVIKTYKELMRGQIGGLRDQYEASTGKKDFDTRYLSESGRQAAHGADQIQPKVEAAGWKYEPAKYEYRMGPDGQLQRKLKSG